MIFRILGIVMVMFGTTMFGIDRAKNSMRNADKYKHISEFYGLLAEKIKNGNIDIAVILSECADCLNDNDSKYINQLVSSLKNSDIFTMKEAYESCIENGSKCHMEYLEEFVSVWDAAGTLGCINCAEKLKTQAYNRYMEMMGNISKEKKLLVYSGIFAGVFIVLILI